LVSCAFAALTITSAPSHASGFADTQLEDEGQTLVLVRSDGSRSPAPKLDDQDSFEAPAVASNHQYAGWLAGSPRFASYSLPVYLVVIDTQNRLKRFRGKWGFVFGWCFADHGRAVIYKYEYAHGITSVAFDMRRISDGKLLRRVDIDPPELGMSEEEILRGRAPSWTKCAQ
jgi:hypothetical protein